MSRGHALVGMNGGRIEQAASMSLIFVAPSFSKIRLRYTSQNRARYDLLHIENATLHFPKFLVIHSDCDNTPAFKRPPFLVAKVLNFSVGKTYKAKKISKGDVLVEGENNSKHGISKTQHCS